MNSFFVQVGVQAIYGRCGFGVCSTDAQDNARLMYRLDARGDVQGATWSVCCIGALVEARLMYRLDTRGDVPVGAIGVFAGFMRLVCGRRHLFPFR